MHCIGIEINLLEMLEDETTKNKKFDPSSWRMEDVAILRRIANFVEREKNDQGQSEQFVKDLQSKTH